MRPLGSKFFRFAVAVFGKIWQIRMLAPPEGWRPHFGEILDSPLYWNSFLLKVVSERFKIHPHSMTMLFSVTQ